MVSTLTRPVESLQWQSSFRRRKETQWKTKNVDWQLQPLPDGILPMEQVTHALLMDIRDHLRSIRKMVTFFTVLVVIGLVVQILVALAK
jgi:hypothetical protein